VKKERLLVLLSSVCLILVLVALPFMSACAKPAPTPKPEPIKLTLVTFQPLTAIKTKMGLVPINKINEAAKGELIIEVIGGPEAIPMKDQGLAVQRGAVDMAQTIAFTGIVPEYGLLSTSATTLAEHRESGFHDLLNDCFKRRGFYYLGKLEYHHLKAFVMFGNKRITTPYDLAGVKVGATHGVTATMREFGKLSDSTWVGIGLTDVYTSLDRGLVDMYYTVWHTIVSFHLYEVSKYFIDHPVNQGISVTVMNLDTWNRLPKHLQDLIESIYFETVTSQMPEYEEITTKSRQTMLDSGMEAIKFSPADAEWWDETIVRLNREEVLGEAPGETTRKLIELIDLMEKKQK